MKIVDLQEIIGSDADVFGPGEKPWNSRRLLLKKDGMGFSMHETIIPANSEFTFWYKNHLEAVYCVSGNGSIEDLATGEVHQIRDGILYALDKHDKHILRGGTEDMRLICTFNPPVSGRETHDADGSYNLPDDE
ncbi:ectoine synthase [Marinobacter sp. R17]|uniref:ectoine synthase n=1 Tax=Marinobacter TaxID=2742 RepID=UPI000F4B904C|nr:MULTISPECIES: ectoine synthase [Marinobacter]ROU01396.1 ectoine synthase [Marinobacter sp. R17]